MKQHDQSPPGSAMIYAVGNKDFMDLLELGFRGTRLMCLTFTNATDAFYEFVTAKPRPTLLITGFLDDEGSGLTLIQKCKLIEPGLKVILWSGHQDEIVASLLARIPVTPDVIVRKGDGFNKLLQTAEQLLGRPDPGEDTDFLHPI